MGINNVRFPHLTPASTTFAMFAHSLLSGVLLLLPIVITVGIYIGIESQKIFNGGFDGKYGVPGSGGSTLDRDVVETSMYCQKLIGITPKGSRYTYNPNPCGPSLTRCLREPIICPSLCRASRKFQSTSSGHMASATAMRPAPTKQPSSPIMSMPTSLSIFSWTPIRAQVR